MENGDVSNGSSAMVCVFAHDVVICGDCTAHRAECEAFLAEFANPRIPAVRDPGGWLAKDGAIYGSFEEYLYHDAFHFGFRRPVVRQEDPLVKLRYSGR